MIPIKIAYTKLGQIGTVSGSVERVNLNGDSLIAYVIFHKEDGDQKHCVYLTPYANADHDEFVLRLKHSIMKHAMREFSTIVYEAELDVLASSNKLADDIYVLMKNNGSEINKAMLHATVRKLTKNFLNN